MSWYYADNNERLGPIEDAAFDALVASSAVRPETLVWREGMTNWLPLSASGYRQSDASLNPGVTPAPAGAGVGEPARQPAVEMGMCSESGRILPRSELVEIDGKLVSVEYKNVVLQRIREGVGASGSDPEALAQKILAEGYNLSIGSCVGRGWSAVKQNFGLCVGAVLLVPLVFIASAFTIIGPIFTAGPLMAGIYWMNLRLHRNEPASMGDAFAGFGRNYWHLVGLPLIMGVTILGCFLPAFICFGLGMAMSGLDHPSLPFAIIAGLFYVTALLAIMYLMTCWVFSSTLIIDKQIECWAAMKLSRRVVSMHWWRVFGVLIVPGLIVMAIMLGAGILLTIIGSILGATIHDVRSLKPIVAGLVILFYCFYAGLIIVAMPVRFSAITAAYEDIFGARPSR